MGKNKKLTLRAASIHIHIPELLLTQHIRARHMIKERIRNEVVKLLLVVKLGFFRNIERLFPVHDLLISFAAVMPETAVVDKKLADDRFTFVGVQ
jgi:hypothetical protein